MKILKDHSAHTTTRAVGVSFQLWIYIYIYLHIYMYINVIYIIYIYMYLYVYINIYIFFFILLLVPMQTYIWQKKKRGLLTDLLKVKNNTFLPDNCHTQKRTYSLNTTHKCPLDVSRGNLKMAMAPYRYTSKTIATRW